jgi:hypothetical protein
MAKKFLSNIFYSPETIKLGLILPQGGGKAATKASPAISAKGRGERMSSLGNFEFAPNEITAELKRLQAFEIILPNLIHKSKKRNLDIIASLRSGGTLGRGGRGVGRFRLAAVNPRASGFLALRKL